MLGGNFCAHKVLAGNLKLGTGRNMNGTVKVYKFRKYDIASDCFLISNRMATRTGIKRINALPIKGTEMEIDRANADDDGMTEIGFSVSTAI
jgi:hypothetical protein